MSPTHPVAKTALERLAAMRRHVDTMYAIAAFDTDDAKALFAVEMADLLQLVHQVEMDVGEIDGDGRIAVQAAEAKAVTS